MANQIVVSAGAKVRNLDGVLTGTSGVVNSLPINASNGIPQLDVNGKILVSQLPNSVMEYKGTWNVSTNTPTLINGVGNQGDVYLVEGAAVGGTAFNFGAGPITFFNGDQAIYSGSIWQRASGATGTVTSVAITESGDSLNITGSPIVNSGTINIGFNGTNLQYVNGAGNLTTFPTLITSIGLSMPSAFSVANSPLTANGTIAVTGAGTTAQYIRGDGSLATFPTIATEAQRLITEVYNETGATLTKGTVVYINGGHGNLPTITKAIATGDATSAQTYGIVQTDITNNNNGYVVVIGSLTDLDTQAYANGTQLYLSSTTAGAWTSVKQYAPAHLVYVGIVTRSHPTQGVVEVRIQNGFEMDELHNVSAQSPLNNQGLFYNTSTSLWENKSIATALGYTPANDALVVHNTGNETIGGTKTFSDATKNNGGIFLQNASSNSLAGYMNLGGLTNGVKFTSGGGVSNTFTLPSATGYTFTFPNATGTLALTSDIPSITGLVPYTGATTNVNLGSNSLTAFNLYSKAIFANNSGGTSGGAIALSLGTTFNSYSGFNTISAAANGVFVFSSDISSGAAYKDARFDFGSLTNSTIRTYTFPDASGTIALVGGSGVGTVTSVAALTIGTSGTDLSSTVANSTTTPVITLNVPTASATNRGALSSADWTTFNNKQGTITLTTTGTSGAATFSANTLNIPNYGSALSGYVPYTGATTNVNLGSYGITASYLTATGGITIQGSGSSIQSGNGLRFYRTDNAIYTNLYDAGTYFALDNRNGNGFDFQSAGTSQMKLNASGNLGLGVTPSAWNVGKGIQIGNLDGATIWGYSGSAQFGNNFYWNGGFLYSTSAEASRYAQGSGAHQWFNAPSGTAGNAITFTQAMTLDASGNFMVGNITNNGAKVVFKGANGVPASSGTATTAVFRISSGTGLYNVLDFGTNESLDYSWIQSTRANSLGTYDYLAIQPNGGNLLVGTLVNSTYKLDVNGTGRFSGRLLVSHATSGNYGAVIYNTSATGEGLVVRGGSTSSHSAFVVQPYDGSVALFNVLATGAATFSSRVNVNNAPDDADIAMTIKAPSGGSKWLLFGRDASNIAVFKVSDTGAATFSSSVTATNGIFSQAMTNGSTGAFTNPNLALKATSSTDTTGFIGMTFATSDAANYGYSYGALRDSGGVGDLVWRNHFNSAQGTELMRLKYNGNVLIGTTDDGGRLVSYSTTAATQIKAAGTAPAITFSNTVLSPTYGGVLGTCTSANQFLTGTSAGDMVLANQFSGYRVYIASYSGGVYLTSGATSWTANSDIRLKNINSHIENAVEKLSTLQTINFSYKDDKTNKQNLGLIAQEVEKIFPELIDKNGDGMLGVRYTELVPVLIKAVQELKLEIETLKNK